MELEALLAHLLPHGVRRLRAPRHLQPLDVLHQHRGRIPTNPNGNGIGKNILRFFILNLDLKAKMLLFHMPNDTGANGNAIGSFIKSCFRASVTSCRQAGANQCQKPRSTRLYASNVKLPLRCDRSLISKFDNPISPRPSICLVDTGTVPRPSRET